MSKPSSDKGLLITKKDITPARTPNSDGMTVFIMPSAYSSFFLFPALFSFAMRPLLLNYIRYISILKRILKRGVSGGKRIWQTLRRRRC